MILVAPNWRFYGSTRTGNRDRIITVTKQKHKNLHPEELSAWEPTAKRVATSHKQHKVLVRVII